MKLKRFFASFSIVCLLFSVSLVPCFANTTSSSVSEYALKLYPGLPGDNNIFANKPILIPSAGTGLLRDTVDATFVHAPLYFYSALFEPKPYERTAYVTVGITSLGITSFMPIGQKLPNAPVWYTKPNDEELYKRIAGVEDGGTERLFADTHLSLAILQIDIPAGANSIRFNTEDFLGWDNQPFEGVSAFSLLSAGAYIVDSGDEAVLNVIESILSSVDGVEGQLSNVNTQLTSVVTGINSILGQLNLISADTADILVTLEVIEGYANSQMLQLENVLIALDYVLSNLVSLNADTDTIITALQLLSDLSESQLHQLELISSNVEAIYYFLTEALAEESEGASESIQETVNSIDNSHAAEAYWQTSMQGNYDSLDLDNFSFGGITGGIELVGRIFSDMFAAFGSYQILFTFPLILGIALLVIGRMSKFGGGNSSRSSEHKGGEGGA